MDLEAFTAVHRDEWDELAHLTRRSVLTGEQADRLVLLYQRTNTHLSTIRSTSADPNLVAELSLLLLRARTKLTGSKEPFLGELRRFFVLSFPAALWRLRWWTFWVAVVCVGVGWGVGAWVAGSREVQLSFLSDAQIRQLVEHDFVGYYSDSPAASFAARVWTNNAWVAAICVTFGIFGFPVPLALWNNTFNASVIGGMMWSAGKGEVFFGYLLPHGLLEITAVFVAAAAGLKIFWCWLDPGPRRRADALAEEGRALFTVALGLVVVLFVSAIVEAFVTPSPLPTWARLSIGALVWLAFLGYQTVLGSAAARAGETGDLRREQRGDTAPIAG